MTVASISARMAGLKDRLNDAYERISDRTDGLIARIDTADQQHANAVAMHSHELDQIESGVKAIESLARQMSNGPFPGEDSSLSTPDANGVSVNLRK